MSTCWCHRPTAPVHQGHTWLRAPLWHHTPGLANSPQAFKMCWQSQHTHDMHYSTPARSCADHRKILPSKLRAHAPYACDTWPPPLTRRRMSTAANFSLPSRLTGSITFQRSVSGCSSSSGEPAPRRAARSVRDNPLLRASAAARWTSLYCLPQRTRSICTLSLEHGRLQQLQRQACATLLRAASRPLLGTRLAPAGARSP